MRATIQENGSWYLRWDKEIRRHQTADVKIVNSRMDKYDVFTGIVHIVLPHKLERAENRDGSGSVLIEDFHRCCTVISGREHGMDAVFVP